MAGPVYQSFATSTYTSAGGTSHPVTINKPSGLSNGDVIFLAFTLRQDDGVGRQLSTDLVFDAAYPWTKVREAEPYNQSAQSARTWTYFRYVANAAGEPASYTATINYAASYGVIAATITARFSGAGPIQPINSSAAFVDTGLAVAFPQVTTTLPDTMLLYVSAARNTQTAFSFSGATPPTVITFVNVTLTAGCTLGMAYNAQSAAGLSAAETGTWSGGGGSTVESTTAALASDLVASTSWIQA
jgi:hypothetical protein